MNVYRGRTITQATAPAQSIGLADFVVRTKFTAFNEDGIALAGAVDLRLPTGRPEDLLGADSSSVRFAAIGSLEGHRVSGHANVGVSVGGLENELSYAAALAMAANGHVTLTGELLGRWIDGPGRIVPVSAANPTLQGVQTIRLTADEARTSIISIVPGFKWNVSDTWVLGANVTIPVTSAGLTARFTPFIGLDYALGR